MHSIIILIMVLLQEINTLNDCNSCQKLINCSKVSKENCSQINVWVNI
jgi:hypothetical protein